MNACFRHHEALVFGVSHVNLGDNHSLSELSPAPRFPELWKKPEAFRDLVGLIAHAGARPVSVWAMQLLRREHAQQLADCAPEDLLAILDHPDEEVQLFGVEWLELAKGLEKLGLDSWLKFLTTKNPTALQRICEIMRRHVSAERLELAQCIEIACVEAAPVARLGLDYLKQRRIESPEDREALAALAHAQCEAFGQEIAAWALGLLGARGAYEIENVTRFFDSLNPRVREGAWAWLRPEVPGHADAALWARLLETPFDDLRLHLIDALEARAKLPGVGPNDMAPLWTTVLLAVHRGGRRKLKALRQISAMLIEKPEQAGALLPALAVALRSVRPTERRAALAALVRVVERQPELAALVQERIPEWALSPVEGATAP